MEMPQIFENKEFGAVRTFRDKAGEPLFVAKDVALALGYEWNGNARIAHIPAEWRGVTSVVTPSGTQEMVVLIEQGLYFFLGRSDKPKALPFQKWLTGEVLPAIRKTGGYGTPQTENEILSRAITIAANRIGLLSQEVAMLQEQIALDAPKVELAEAIMETEECVSVNQFAKILKQNGLDIGANRLYRDLRKDGYLIRRKGANWNMPKQRMMDKGYFRVVERSTDTEDDYQFVTVTTMLTGMGQYHLFAHFLNKYGVRRQLSLFEGRARA
jgi:anti-repressor protein